MSVVKFRSTPMFEERLCTGCLRKGDPDPYLPADSEFWLRSGGLLDFRLCKACRAEVVARSKARRYAANDDAVQEAA